MRRFAVHRGAFPPPVIPFLPPGFDDVRLRVGWPAGAQLDHALVPVHRHPELIQVMLVGTGLHRHVRAQHSKAVHSVVGPLQRRRRPAALDIVIRGMSLAPSQLESSTPVVDDTENAPPQIRSTAQPTAAIRFALGKHPDDREAIQKDHQRRHAVYHCPQDPTQLSTKGCWVAVWARAVNHEVYVTRGVDGRTRVPCSPGQSDESSDH